MRTSRLLRWSGSVLSPRTRPCFARTQAVYALPSRRFQSSAAAAEAQDEVPAEEHEHGLVSITKTNYNKLYTHLTALPSPPPSAALSSAKLSALHARLQLPKRIPLQTLARCLVHKSADPDPAFNNSSLEVLGQDILGYYTSELILCTYPRLPMDIVYGSMKAYTGPAACAAITREWGVESAAEPGGEVDPGLLQFRRVTPGNADVGKDGTLQKDVDAKKAKTWAGFPTTTTQASISDTYFGPIPTALEIVERPELAEEKERMELEASRVTLGSASMSFVRALLGALYLHAGRDAAKAFFDAHFRSRKLDVSRMFYFKQPTRDLSKLCAREGFESPVARMISETGRLSRHPVYVVGVFSGKEKLGEGSGGNLNEARIRAAISSLKGWYLYSPLKVRVPSDVEGGKGEPWQPALIDGGEIIV